VLLLLPGVGQATAATFMAHLSDVAAAAGVDLMEAFLRYDVPASLQTREVLGLLRDVLADARGDGTAEPPPSAQIDALSRFCAAVFELAYDDPGARLADIEHLAALAADARTRSGFLTDITLDPPASTSGLADAPYLDDDYLVLSTIHSAKGGEWRSVTVIHAADGNIPSDMALSDPAGVEEERRLLYVALTRARDHLAVTVPQRFYHHRHSTNGAHTYALRSRFLDVTEGLFDEHAFGVPAVTEEPAWSGTGARSVATDLAALWE
jgi:DNA helicase-2/ATP-dependent DNA helicase PcrA